MPLHNIQCMSCSFVRTPLKFVFCSLASRQTCVCRLLDSESPLLDTIKMQVHFDMNYSSRSECQNGNALLIYGF